MILYIKIDKENIKFDSTEIKKHKFHQNKKLILIKNIDINKIVVSDQFPFGKQNFADFIGYKDYKTIRPSCIFFPKVSEYILMKLNVCMFMIEKNVFDKYMEIWGKVSNIIIIKK